MARSTASAARPSSPIAGELRSPAHRSGVLYVADNSGVRRIGHRQRDDDAGRLADRRSAPSTATATTARFSLVNGLAVGPNGDVFVSDNANNAIRRIDAAGNVTTYAGVMGQARAPTARSRRRASTRRRKLAFAPDGTL